MNKLILFAIFNLILVSCTNKPKITDPVMKEIVKNEGYEKYLGPPLGESQGHDEIIINASKSIVWKAISDSSILHEWGPPVQRVEILYKAGEKKEGLGTVRKVYALFEGQYGYFLEHRTEEVFEQRIAYMIDRDKGLGVLEILEFPGFNFELTEISPNKTKVVMDFTHNTKGFKGWILNPFIKWKFGKNRLAALRALKSYSESKVN